MKTKNAILTLASFWVNCPYCKEDVFEPRTGSLLWNEADTKPNSVVTCNFCLKTFTIPNFSREIKIKRKEN